MTVEELARELFTEVHNNLGHRERDPNQFMDFDEVPPRKRAWIEIARVFCEGIVDGSPASLYRLVHRRLGDGNYDYPVGDDGRRRSWIEIARVLRQRAWQPTTLAQMQIEAITLRIAIEKAQERLFALDREQEALEQPTAGLTEAEAERAAAFARGGQGAAAIAGLLREEAAAKGRQQAAEMEQRAAKERQERVNDGLIGGHGRHW